MAYEHVFKKRLIGLGRVDACQERRVIVAALPVAFAVQRYRYDTISAYAGRVVCLDKQHTQWLRKARVTIVFERVDIRAQRLLVGAYSAQATELERSRLAVRAYAPW